MISFQAIGLLASLLLSQYISALQVTPNSPCAALCIDSPGLDESDPNSSNTRNSDITCDDRLYDGSAAGIKWKSCMTCLQNSTFFQGSESDQGWFLYNLRYTFDYCIFGFPNATDVVGSSPCQTSSACGGLQLAMEEGHLKPNNSSMYGYCSADGGSVTGLAYNKCLACISAGGDTNYVANGLVALEAGCLQRPTQGKIVGLNDTIFSDSIISIVDPTTVADTPPASENKPAMSTTTIAIIAVVTLAVLALVSALIYVQIRKRRRSRMIQSSPNPGATKKWTGHRPKSSMSFRCQTHLSPRSPGFPEDCQEKGQVRQITAETSIMGKKSHHSMTSLKHTTKNPTAISQRESSQGSTVVASNAAPAALARLDTAVAATCTDPPSKTTSPASTRSSPMLTRGSPVAKRRRSSILTTGISPSNQSDNPFGTPTSATPLVPPSLPPMLPRYNPADYGINSAARGEQNRASPNSAGSLSPTIPQFAWAPPMSQGMLANRSPLSPMSPPPTQPLMPQPQPPPAPAKVARTSFPLGGWSRRQGSEPGSSNGSPSEVPHMQLMFQAPPQRPQRK